MAKSVGESTFCTRLWLWRLSRLPQDRIGHCFSSITLSPLSAGVRSPSVLPALEEGPRADAGGGGDCAGGGGHQLPQGTGEHLWETRFFLNNLNVFLFFAERHWDVRSRQMLGEFFLLLFEDCSPALSPVGRILTNFFPARTPRCFSIPLYMHLDRQGGEVKMLWMGRGPRGDGRSRGRRGRGSRKRGGGANKSRPNARSPHIRKKKVGIGREEDYVCFLGQLARKKRGRRGWMGRAEHMI